jgi:two-component system, LytTR family, sensor kinase
VINGRTKGSNTFIDDKWHWSFYSGPTCCDAYFCTMKKRILFDIKAWLLVLVLFPFGVHAPTLTQRIGATCWIWLMTIVMHYSHQWLIQHFAKKGKWVPYGAGVLTLIFGLTGVSTLAAVSTDFWNILSSVVIALFMTTAVSYAYKGIWLQIQYEKIRRQQVEAELKLLQSQVNPHFLFNTLNNIYAQNLSNPNDANDMILQLADLMRYQTESSKKNQVLLSEELQFMNNYIALEKKRLTDHTTVTLQVDVPVEPPVSVPPMLFIPFVENAFKHGIGIGAGSFIHIHLSVQEKWLTFDLKNSVPMRKRSLQSTQTGLENVKKRLDLLFGERYKLAVHADTEQYHTRLEIQIT